MCVLSIFWHVWLENNGEKRLSLRGATHKLKAEALRRYRIRHQDDALYEAECSQSISEDDMPQSQLEKSEESVETSSFPKPTNIDKNEDTSAKNKSLMLNYDQIGKQNPEKINKRSSEYNVGEKSSKIISNEMPKGDECRALKQDELLDADGNGQQSSLLISNDPSPKKQIKVLELSVRGTGPGLSNKPDSFTSSESKTNVGKFLPTDIYPHWENFCLTFQCLANQLHPW